MSTKKLFIFVTLSLVIAWFLYPQILPFIFIYLPEPELKEFSELYGTVGDSFGALNTLFSGLALIGVVFSLHAQSKESKENYKRQQEQNSYNQEVLEKTRIQVQLQEEIGRVQNFENTFFHLLELFKNTTNAIHVKESGNDFLGGYAIDYLWEELNNKFKTKENNKKYLDIYEELYIQKNHKHLGTYFRVLYSLVKYVDNNEFLDCTTYRFNRKYYIGIIRANISSNELNILFYNCLSTKGREKFKPRIEKYAFFEHIPGDSDWYPSYYVHEYSKEAYGDNQKLIELWNKCEKDMESFKK